MECIDKEEVIIQIHPTAYSEDILVYIPYKFWMDSRIANGIKKTVDMTFEKQHENQK